MKEELFSYYSELFNYYLGGNLFYILIWIAALAFLFFHRRAERAGLVYPFLILLILLGNPAAILILVRMSGVGEASRFIWCFMGAFVIALAASDFIHDKLTDKHIRYIITLVIMAVLVLGGSHTYTRENTDFPANLMNISPDAVQAAGKLAKDHPGEKVIVGEGIISELHQCDATIPMYYGRWKTKKYIENKLNGKKIKKLAKYLKKARKKNVTVIVLPRSPEYNYRMGNCGWFITDKTDNYDIYEYRDCTWVVSDYIDASGNQGMFYTIYNRDTKDLVAVDSGWKENEDQVRRVLKFLGGDVKAWFITHFDNDHVDSFNAIYGDPGKIDIDKIYITPLDYELYKKSLRKWDTPESFETFLAQTEGDNRVTPLSRGDSFGVCGLEAKVFNAYDDIVKKKGSEDLPNNASLVFRLSSGDRSMLFTGDCHDLGDELAAEWGDDLKSDYVQVGHHGHNSFPNEFYDIISPDTAFFDAPAWEMNDDKYTAGALRDYLRSKGVFTVDFTDTGHSFILE